MVRKTRRKSRKQQGRRRTKRKSRKQLGRRQTKKIKRQKGGAGKLFTRLTKRGLVPLFRFVKDTDPKIEVAWSQMKTLTFSSGVQIQYHSAMYNLSCDPTKSNNVQDYLDDPTPTTFGQRGASNWEGSNINGFFKHDSGEDAASQKEMRRPETLNDYYGLSNRFRNRHDKQGENGKNRLIFVTTYDPRKPTTREHIKIGNNDFLNIDCRGGLGRPSARVEGTLGGRTVSASADKENAECPDPRWPGYTSRLAGVPDANNECAEVPTAANLGILMGVSEFERGIGEYRNQNERELNLIGAVGTEVAIPGIIITGIADNIETGGEIKMLEGEWVPTIPGIRSGSSAASKSGTAELENRALDELLYNIDTFLSKPEFLDAVDFEIEYERVQKADAWMPWFKGMVGLQ